MIFPRAAIDEAFSLLPSMMDTANARVIHAAIGFQESAYRYRRQVVTVNGKLVEAGPACGYWQFEKGGGVKGVMGFGGVVEREARRVCRVRGVPWSADQVWFALSQDDVLAAAFARLLMYTDAAKLPTTPESAWRMYERVWRPGKPHPETWAKAYAFGLEQYP